MEDLFEVVVMQYLKLNFLTQNETCLIDFLILEQTLRDRSFITSQVARWGVGGGVLKGGDVQFSERLDFGGQF